MPRYFFDIHDNEANQRDEVGLELPDLDAARQEAMKSLPAIAYDEIRRDSDRQTYVVLVIDEDGKPVYSATLNYSGLWLLR